MEIIELLWKITKDNLCKVLKMNFGNIGSTWKWQYFNPPCDLTTFVNIAVFLRLRLLKTGKQKLTCSGKSLSVDYSWKPWAGGQGTDKHGLHHCDVCCLPMSCEEAQGSHSKCLCLSCGNSREGPCRENHICELYTERKKEGEHILLDTFSLLFCIGLFFYSQDVPPTSSIRA